MQAKSLNPWLSAIAAAIALSASSGLLAASKWCYGPTLEKAKCGRYCLCTQEENGSWSCNCQTVTSKPKPASPQSGSHTPNKMPLVSTTRPGRRASEHDANVRIR